MLQELFGEYTVDYGGTKVGRLTVSGQGLMTRFTCECVVATAEIMRLAILMGDRYIALGVLLPDGDKLHFTKSYSKNDLRQKGLSSIDGARLVGTHDIFTVPVSAPAPTPMPTPEPNLVGDDAHIVPSPPEPEPISEPEPNPDPVGDAVPSVPPLPEPEPMPEPEPIPEPNPVGDDAHIVPPPPEPHMEVAQELSEDAVLLTHAAHIEAPEPTAPKWTPHPDPGILFTDPDLIAACRHVTGALTRPCGGDCIELAVPFEAGSPFPLMPVFCRAEAAEISGNAYLLFRINNGKLTN